MNRFLLFLILIVCISSCNISKDKSRNSYSVSTELVSTSGRTSEKKDSSLILINSASAINFELPETDHAYINLEISDTYKGRFKVKKSLPLKFPLNDRTGFHDISIFKATEASTGAVIVKKIEAFEIDKLDLPKRPEIEFIGNSITCGMGADTLEIPCGNGEWYDQHNAYMA